MKLKELSNGDAFSHKREEKYLEIKKKIIECGVIDIVVGIELSDLKSSSKKDRLSFTWC